MTVMLVICIGLIRVHDPEGTLYRHRLLLNPNVTVGKNNVGTAYLWGSRLIPIGRVLQFFSL